MELLRVDAHEEWDVVRNLMLMGYRIERQMD